MGRSQGGLMSGWRRLLEEESEHQWLSFAVFTILVITGAVLIDWSNELSGVHQGGQMNADGIIYDSAGDAIMYQAESGMRISHNELDNSAQYATCLEQYKSYTFACTGQEGSILIIEEGSPDCEAEWCSLQIGEGITANHVSMNDFALLMVVQDGTSDSLAAMSILDSSPSPLVTEHEGNMHLDTMLATNDGWLVGGSWQAPANWLGSNPASPPMFELILSVTWDGITVPSIEIIHMGDEGTIHGLFEVEDGFIATGIADTIRIKADGATSMGISSYAAVGDNNDNVWLFGNIGSSTVAVISNDDVDVEKLPEPLKFVPTHVSCGDDGMISVHGMNGDESPGAISIDSNARSSFTSLRGILDLGFILVSLMIMSIMAWNVTDAIRKGQVF